MSGTDETLTDEPMTAEVLLRGRRVGWLDVLQDDFATCQLRFDPAWIETPNRGVLGQWFEDRLPAPLTINGGMPLWFKSLLPQGPMRRYLASRHGLHELDEFELLLALGEDLPGAVQLVSTLESQLPRRSRRPSSDARPTGALEPGIFAPRHSLSGFQWKLSVQADERGIVVPVSGRQGEWIAKFENGTYPHLPEIETATMAWAAKAGIHCAETRLEHRDRFLNLPSDFPTGSGMVLLSRRFDRKPWTHMEDFSQILDRPDQFAGTAEEVGVVIAALCPEQDVREYLRRLVFCVLSGNGDAHLKNWTLTYPDGRSARLSPAYDLVPTRIWLRNQDLVLPLGGERVFDRLTATHFGPMASLTGIGGETMTALVATAASQVRAAWKQVRHLFDPRHHQGIEAHLAACRL